MISLSRNCFHSECISVPYGIVEVAECIAQNHESGAAIGAYASFRRGVAVTEYEIVGMMATPQVIVGKDYKRIGVG